MYVITSGNLYIARKSTGFLHTVNNADIAFHYLTKDKASYYLSILPKSFYQLAPTWRVEEYPKPQSKEPEPEKKIEPVEIPLDLKELLSNVGNLKECREGYRAKLLENLSIVDQKLSDVYHFVEFNPKLNVVGGYRCYQMLVEVLTERRKIKDSIHALDILAANCNLDVISDKVHIMNTRTYKPNQYTGLFDTDDNSNAKMKAV